MLTTGPRTLRDPAVRAARQALHARSGPTAPLRDWAADLAARRSAVVPFFDPTDAGVDAQILFLLEAPGPMTNAANSRPGSGFISADNDDPTAENIWRARSVCGLLDGALHWNIVPWYLGPATVKPSSRELAEGATELLGLLSLLPRLRAVVLCGRYAQRGWREHVASRIVMPQVVETWHPSPLALNRPGRREEFERAVASAP